MQVAQSGLTFDETFYHPIVDYFKKKVFTADAVTLHCMQNYNMLKCDVTDDARIFIFTILYVFGQPQVGMSYDHGVRLFIFTHPDSF